MKLLLPLVPIFFATVILSFIAGHLWIPNPASGASAWIMIPGFAGFGFLISSAANFIDLTD